MSEEEQVRRALRWSEELPVESKATAAALDALSPEVRDRVVQAANIGRTINIQKVSVSCAQFCCKFVARHDDPRRPARCGVKLNSSPFAFSCVPLCCTMMRQV